MSGAGTSRLNYSFGILILIAGAACSGPTVVPEPTDELGCIRPAGLVGLNPIDVHILKTSIKGFTFGGLDITTKPEVFQALQAGARDALSHEYIVCRSQKQGFIMNGSQANHVRSKLQFMATSPSSDQYTRWENDHPYPPN